MLYHGEFILSDCMWSLFLFLGIFFVALLWAGHKRIQLVYISCLHVNIYLIFYSCSTSYTFFSLSSSCEMNNLSFHLAVNIMIQCSCQTFKWMAKLRLPLISSHHNSKCWRPYWFLPTGTMSFHHVIMVTTNRMVNSQRIESLLISNDFFCLNSFSSTDIYEYTDTGKFSNTIQF
jgi:hypothetical protein